MSSTERRRGGTPQAGPWLLLGGLGMVAAAGLAIRAACALTGVPVPEPNPFVLPLYAVRGQVAFTTATTAVTAAIGLVMLALIIIGARLVLRRRKPHRHVDAAVPHMARGRELQRLTREEAAKTARRIGAQTDVPGVLIGDTIAPRRELWADWESTEVDIWGPRTGKTTSRAIPTVLDAPGAVVATSNRRDLVDATRDVRAMRGTVLVFDPQQIVAETPTFYWDPLSYVLSGPAGSEVKAQQLAGIFTVAGEPPESRRDKFFDPKGEALLGHLLHAAALDGLGMAKVYEWVNDETNAEPARILDKHRFGPSADYVRGVIGSPDKQRGGVYATAELAITWMTNRAVADWITPGRGRVQLDPALFATSTDTLYLVSREGRGTLAPLTTALTAAVCEAAEHEATRSPRGRLRTPMVVVLDEVANVCRWPELPNLYSHYGGRGIYLLAILQSWRQGEDTWGARGMAKLWSAATVRIYGGGDTEVQFLDELRRLVGTYRPQQVSSGHSKHGVTRNYSEGSDDVLDVADLSAMPRGRALLIASGARPVLFAPRPWYDGPHAGEVELSIAAHDPAASPSRATLHP